MVEVIILKKLSDSEKKRVDELKSFFGVKTASKAVKLFLMRGKYEV